MRSCKYADNCKVCKWKPCPHDNHRSFVSAQRAERAKSMIKYLSVREIALVLGISKSHTYVLLKK